AGGIRIGRAECGSVIRDTLAESATAPRLDNELERDPDHHVPPCDSASRRRGRSYPNVGEPFTFSRTTHDVPVGKPRHGSAPGDVRGDVARGSRPNTRAC